MRRLAQSGLSSAIHAFIHARRSAHYLHDESALIMIRVE
jgi:hypothetical protein